MTALATIAAATAERFPIPDALSRLGITMMVARTREKLAAQSGSDGKFAADMVDFPIAQHTDAANAQHYEVPAAFFGKVLGQRRKYSSCLYETGRETLAEAEILALQATVDHAAIMDGQDILELGCGWGSLTLFMGEMFPSARITAVSNSASQRAHIEAEARSRGLTNIRVITADMNDFRAEGRFDRIVSVEMFEHMANWRPLLSGMRDWLRPNGLAMIHIFTHRLAPYRFDLNDKADWIAQHFFTGGIMPSRQLMRCFPDLFSVEQEWQWSGQHYQRTADDWLRNFDANRADIRQILSPVYGRDTAVWERRWRLFFLATAGLFGHADGEEWGVTHYRLRPA
ncbi:class I SAM-dependent methyltransferase [Acidisoma cellulosilytica]|uniref:Class I SAM-dependent methyltransferase n=1 Tax=Acidisoma cellulosilyticum TaxID=2802395 RepID=A0A963YZN9_9PROT|nr:cyclopropane-fatty-acyl-phospholipid synthase family protein [Acidisoma cellulosilyticum]MCB8880041.1 class I SAM-dependent methyltransferase [Acidisoma cellulosilyticum]